MTTDKLRKNRRMGYFLCGVVGMAVAPSVDPVTTTLQAVPLFVLFEGSIILCAFLDRRAHRLKPAARDVTRGGLRRLGRSRSTARRSRTATWPGRTAGSSRSGRGRVDRHYGEDALILPGIVNAHSHLEYSVYAGFGDGEPFGSWLATHIARKRVLTRDDMVAIARHGAAESLAAGITTTADYSFSGRRRGPRPTTGAAGDRLPRGLRRRPGEPTARFEELRAGVEETELVTGRHLAARALHLLARRLPLLPLARHPGRDAPRRERRRERVARARHGPALGGRATSSSTPTGKRAVATLEERPRPRPALRALRRARRRRDRGARRGRRPGRALPALERAPRLRHRARSRRCARPAIRVGLGTDSPASTPSFDPWDEMRAALAGARARERRPDALSAAAALRLATLGAAAALGLDDELGSLTPGKRADLTVALSGRKPVPSH